MKIIYVEPAVRIIPLELDDVLTDSNDSDTNSQKDQNWTPFEPNQP